MDILKRVYKRYVLDAMSAMVLGIFSSLVIGLIIEQFSKIPGLSILKTFSDNAKTPLVVGMAIGVAIGYVLKVKPLAMCSAGTAGALGYTVGGGPVGAFLAGVVAAELGNLVSGRTKVDLIVVPVTAIVSGGLITLLTGPGVKNGLAALQGFIETATRLQPIPMGIVLSVVFGLLLTGPLSSAAMALAIFTVPEGQTMSNELMLAAGAATVGCCCHMVGFAVASFRENGVGGLLTQGLGSSKLQLGNALRRPAILLPAVLSSAILGPFATTVFQMKNIPGGAGMGTSGLVGQFGTWAAMASEGAPSVLWRIAILQIILPAVLAIVFSELFRKLGLIKYGDMKLDL